MTSCDALIVGAGPAGCAAAITLARAGKKVMLVEKRTTARFTSCETVPPVAMGLVQHFLGATDTALSGCSAKTAGNVSVWGHETPDVQDFIFTPNGSGLCIERSGFDALLQELTTGSGVTLLRGWKTVACEPESRSGGWVTRIRSTQKTLAIRSRYLVDATGRSSTISTLAGIERVREDRLFSFALRFTTTRSGDNDGFTRIEACPFGWWYSNAIPSGQQTTNANRYRERIVVLHVDRDLPEARTAATVSGFMALLLKSTLIYKHLCKYDYRPEGHIKGAAAGGERSSTQSLPGFMAVGDAAQAFDPLSSQGVYQALQSGDLAGRSLVQACSYRDIDRALKDGDDGKALKYQRIQDQHWAQYQKDYTRYYAMEARWINQPFWQRRHASNTDFQPAAVRVAQ